MIKFVSFLFFLIPYPVLYLLSDTLSLLFNYIVQYRKSVIKHNLKKVFPDLSKSEMQKIIRDFYRNLTDILLESIKANTISEKTIRKRYKFRNIDLLDASFASGKSVIASAAHLANWEWGALSFGMHTKHTAVGFYKPLSNTFVDNYIHRVRSKFGTVLASIYETRQWFEKDFGQPACYIMVSDQNPGNRHKAHWVDFLGQDTACLHGLDNYARSMDLPVYFCDIRRIRRGHYEVVMELIEQEPSAFTEGAITKKYMKHLEQKILANPSSWLWSHKRWKHKRE